MSEELSVLPMTSMNKLCDASINVARQIDGMMRLLVRDRGYAKVSFDVVKGELGILRIERSFRMLND